MILKHIAAAFACLAVTVAVAPAQTLKAVQDRGHLICGVSEGLPGFSARDTAGAWSGFDVDYCRALAAAIFNDARKVEFVPLTAGDRFGALQSKRIDVLSRNSTWTMGRETELGLLFAAVSYYDGQGFMVRKSPSIESALELEGKSICAQSGTTTELNVADFFRNNRLNFSPMTFATVDEAVRAYDERRCDAFTADVSALHALRPKMRTPTDHLILPDVISKEPLGPVVRQDDVRWLNIVKWVQFALVNAEELGVTRTNLDEALRSQKSSIRRLLGVEGNYGEQLGLTKDWALRAVRAVGNYGELFERTVGSGSPLAIPRGLNNLWDKGGIQYAPPIR